MYIICSVAHTHTHTHTHALLGFAETSSDDGNVVPCVRSWKLVRVFFSNHAVKVEGGIVCLWLKACLTV